jgi:hypothetical protein
VFRTTFGIPYGFHARHLYLGAFFAARDFVVFSVKIPWGISRAAHVQQSPRYDAVFQRRAVEEALLYHQSVAQVARQLCCSPQSSAKRHGLDEWQYLTDVLNRLAELRELLPDR